MNNKPTKLLFAALLSLLLFVPQVQLTAEAQPHRPAAPGRPGAQPFNPQEYKQKVRDFIIREAKLSPQQANIVFPIFFEVKDMQRDLSHKIGKACARATTEHLSERDCERILTEVKRLQRQIADLEQSLYDRLRQKGIPASKVLAIKMADEKFRRTTFRDATQRPRR